MENFKSLINSLELLAEHPIKNYAIPGLSSKMILNGNNGKIRLFEQELYQHDTIVPHSHRYDIDCLVLKGCVRNKIWHPVADKDVQQYNTRDLALMRHYDQVMYEMGDYAFGFIGKRYYFPVDVEYTEGMWYHMDSEDIHSIEFEKGTKVLFFQGVDKQETSSVIAPDIDDLDIGSYVNVENWMFKKVGDNA